MQDQAVYRPRGRKAPTISPDMRNRMGRDGDFWEEKSRPCVESVPDGELSWQTRENTSGCRFAGDQLHFPFACATVQLSV